MIILLERNYSK